MQMEQILEQQRSYFQTGATLPVPFRIAQLKKLYAAVKAHEAELCRALAEDLGKSAYESFMCEAGLV